MGTNPETDVEPLAQEILRYLASHGEAADTVDGISRWWIKRQRLEETRTRVQGALDLLVREARLQSRVTPLGNTLYMLPGVPVAPSSAAGRGPESAAGLAADASLLRPNEPGEPDEESLSANERKQRK